jgi:uncharacterized protein (DUF58 family)
MSRPARRLLDPATLAGIRDLRLVALAVVEGFLSGEHPARRTGPGIEFSQYRSYEPGDDPRRVDWRLYGRTDRFFVRESEIDSDVTVRLLLDASASMAQRGSGLSKFDYARFLAAALAYLAHKQGDRIAFRPLGGESALGEPSGGGAPSRDLAAVLHQLESLEPAGRWPAELGVEGLAAGRRERELVVLASDLCQHTSEILDVAVGLRLLGHEVIVFHLLSAEDLAFPFEGDLELVDLETGERVRGSGGELRAGYLRRLTVLLAELRRRLDEVGAVYEALRTDRPLDLALRHFVARRQRC